MTPPDNIAHLEYDYSSGRVYLIQNGYRLAITTSKANGLVEIEAIQAALERLKDYYRKGVEL